MKPREERGRAYWLSREWVGEAMLVGDAMGMDLEGEEPGEAGSRCMVVVVGGCIYNYVCV